MKYLLIGLVFLVMGSQTLLAKGIITKPEILETQPGVTLLNKPVVCGPTKAVLDKVAEFNEVPTSAWIDAEWERGVIFYINKNTGTTTVVEQVGEMMCILSQGIGGTIVPRETIVPPSKKIKGMSIKYLTF